MADKEGDGKVYEDKPVLSYEDKPVLYRDSSSGGRTLRPGIKQEFQRAAMVLFAEMQAGNLKALEVARKNSIMDNSFGGAFAVKILTSGPMQAVLEAIDNADRLCLEFLTEYPEIDQKFADALKAMLEANTTLVTKHANLVESFAGEANTTFTNSVLSRGVLRQIILPTTEKVNVAMNAVIDACTI